MDKLKMHSPNFADENIEKLATLFPGCVTESTDEDGNLKKSIDFDQLRQELSNSIVEGPQERYHLNWPGKKEASLTANAPIAKTLRPCREESVDFDTTENLFIEGDNLDALKLLQETYLGKVKVIYIDPPYNTGKDFIYADNFAESTEEYLLDSGQKDEKNNRLVANTDSNGRFHSDWLSMMYSRLKLARNLLKEDGSIFISIDDGEQQNIGKICDEIFGRENFVSCNIWHKKYAKQNDTKYLSVSHDYVLLYAKNKEKWVPGRLARSEEQLKNYKNPDNDPRGPWQSVIYTCGKTKAERPNLYYPIINPFKKNKVYPSETRVWGCDSKQTQKNIEQNRLWWGINGELDKPRKKVFLSELKDGVVPDTLWSRDIAGDTQTGKREILSLFTNSVFDTPKPSKLIQHVLNVGNVGKGELVMDFFAGSASTAHAVIQQNALDGANRNFIMVQLSEVCDEKSEAFKAGYKTIAEISKERIRRIGKKIKEENATIAPNLDIGFRLLKVDSSNMEDVYYAPDAVEQKQLNLLTDNIKDDRSSEDLLFQVLLDLGVDLTLPMTKETLEDREVFFVDGNALSACFAKNGQITEDFCKELAKRQPLRAVFRDSGFKDDSVKINVEQIFKLMSPHTDVKTI